MKPTIGNIVDTGKPLAIDIDRLLLTRMLLQADSGGGKTVALKRLLEQTHGHVQQIIIDPEGEFSTLREKFDYLLCAPEGADAIANPKTAAILARKLRETRVSAVIDIYDLRPQEQKHFVRLFVEELLAAPKNLWNPCLVVIDEAQVFAPEGDKAESLGAIMDLRGRGRKRGLCVVLATPRLASLSKDACAGLQNKMIGVTTLDLDVKRAARDLALTPIEATTMLRNLEPGEFFCFGPALTRAITKVKVGTIKTRHGQHTAGKDTRPPAPSEKIKAVLAKLADLPKEAEQEAKTMADLKRENANLKRDLTMAKKAQPSASPVKIKTIEKPVVGKRAVSAFEKSAKDIRRAAAKVQSAYTDLESVLRNTFDATVSLEKTIQRVTNTNMERPSSIVAGKPTPGPMTGQASAPTYPRLDAKSIRASKMLEAMSVREGGNGAAIAGPQQRIIDAIAWFESIGIMEPEIVAVAFLAGYIPGGGAFNNPKGSLRAGGMIEYRGSRLALTDGGRAAAQPIDNLLSNDDVQLRVLGRLPGPERKLLKVAIERYPDPITDQELAEATGYAIGGGAFNNPKGRLRTLGVVTYPSSKMVRAADLLFPFGSENG